MPDQVRSNDAARHGGAARIDMKVVVIPVSDVDRAKEFYERIGWQLNFDRSAGEDFRLVQFTPRGSCCSVHFERLSCRSRALFSEYRNLPLATAKLAA
jgi:hypothetical protein